MKKRKPDKLTQIRWQIDKAKWFVRAVEHELLDLTMAYLGAVRHRFSDRHKAKILKEMLKTERNFWAGENRVSQLRIKEAKEVYRMRQKASKR